MMMTRRSDQASEEGHTSMQIPPNEQFRGAREALQGLAAIMTILAVLGGVIVYFLGSWRPEQTAALAEQMGQLRTTISELTQEVRQLPRAADYAVHESHLQQLDRQVGGLVDRITKDEIEAKGIAQQVQQLSGGTGTPVRNPR